MSTATGVNTTYVSGTDVGVVSQGLAIGSARPTEEYILLEFHILGALEVIGPEGNPIVVSSPKQRSLLLYLLVNRGQVCSADRILDAVWEDDTPTIKTVQFHLSKLRDTLEPRRAR